MFQRPLGGRGRTSRPRADFRLDRGSFELILSMGWWPFSRRDAGAGQPRDYYREALELAEGEKFHEALTSFRLALRQRPDDVRIMQQMGMIYTQIGMPEEAVRFYERALEVDPRASGAHYGLAFLCLRGGDHETAREHLRAFLANPPTEEEAGAHVEHARSTLRRLDDSGDTPGDPPEPADGS